MNITTKGVLYHTPENIEIFIINVPEESANMIAKKLLSEKKKINSYLTHLKRYGLIKSIFRPKNKKIQKKLNNLIAVKKIINNSIETIKTIYG